MEILKNCRPGRGTGNPTVKEIIEAMKVTKQSNALIEKAKKSKNKTELCVLISEVVEKHEGKRKGQAKRSEEKEDEKKKRIQHLGESVQSLREMKELDRRKLIMAVNSLWGDDSEDKCKNIQGWVVGNDNDDGELLYKKYINADPWTIEIETTFKGTNIFKTLHDDDKHLKPADRQIYVTKIGQEISVNEVNIAILMGVLDIGPKVYDAWICNDPVKQTFLVMEYLPGQTFGEYMAERNLKTRSELPLEIRTNLAQQIAKIPKGITVVDLHNDNIILMHNNNVKLIDFGMYRI